MPMSSERGGKVSISHRDDSWHNVERLTDETASTLLSCCRVYPHVATRVKHNMASTNRQELSSLWPMVRTRFSSPSFFFSSSPRSVQCHAPRTHPRDPSCKVPPNPSCPPKNGEDDTTTTLASVTEHITFCLSFLRSTHSL